MMKLVTGLTLLLSTLGLAQTDDHALLLLREVDSSARTTKNWRAEGVIASELTGNGMQMRDEIRFKITVQSPFKMRRENTGDDHTLSVCDGTDRFYSGDGRTFYVSPVAVSNDCNLSLADFYKLEQNPVSAIVIGRDHVQLFGGIQECEVVHAEWNRQEQGRPGPVHVIRTMCIDAVRHLILRDRTESTIVTSDMHSVTTTIFTNYESNPNLPLDAFQPSIPTGTIFDQGPKMDESVAIEGVYPPGPYPRLVSKVEPSYTEEAREVRLWGVVLVSLTVAEDGAPQNMKVVRGLGHGLDDKAIESVGKWHFEPGMRDGVPVAVGPLTVAVNFRLP